MSDETRDALPPFYRLMHYLRQQVPPERREPLPDGHPVRVLEDAERARYRRAELDDGRDDDDDEY